MIDIQGIDEEAMRTVKDNDEEEYLTHYLLDSSQGKKKTREDVDGSVGVIKANVHTAIPVIDDYTAVLCQDDEGNVISEEGEIDEKSLSNPNYYGSLSIMVVHVCSFLALVFIFGIDSISSNPLIGPPIAVIEEYGAKDPIKIKEGREYWRIFTAMFINIGFLDLFFTVCILYTFGRCLEKQWGCIKWLSFYILSGIGGNLYSSFTQQTAISAGNGGCILGLLGAMHVDFVTSILLYPYQEHGVESSRSKKPFIFMNDEESCFTCALTVIGLFIGIITIAMNEYIYPIVEDEDDESTTVREYYMLYNNKVGDDINMNMNNVGGKVGDHGSLTSMRKDWSVLYGGMLTGIFCACIWNLFALNIPISSRCSPSLMINEEAHHDTHYLTRTELFFRLTMLVMPLLVLELIFTMMK